MKKKVALCLASGGARGMAHIGAIEEIRASISIPLCFEPVKHNGSLLVDGGLCNPFPLNRVARLEDDILVGVNISGTSVMNTTAEVELKLPSKLQQYEWARKAEALYEVDSVTRRIYYVKPAKYTMDHFMGALDIPTCFGIGTIPDFELAEKFAYYDKTMILGASGQNIYPEDIESKLNNLPSVSESVVVEREGKLVALVFPDEVATRRSSVEEMQELMRENLKKLNKLMPGYSQVSNIELQEQPFEKTPKKSIKRFLYK